MQTVSCNIFIHTFGIMLNYKVIISFVFHINNDMANK